MLAGRRSEASLDSSAAGKAQGAPNMDAWGRAALGAGANVVATAEAVRPSRDPRRLRDKTKGKNEGDAPEQVEAEPHGDVSATALALQAVDPESGRVLWQTTAPDEDAPAAPAATDPNESVAKAPLDNEHLAEGHTGLLGKRAYHGGAEAVETPRIVKTA
jgi:hypothetical protein